MERVETDNGRNRELVGIEGRDDEMALERSMVFRLGGSLMLANSIGWTQDGIGIADSAPELSVPVNAIIREALPTPDWNSKRWLCHVL